MTPNEIGWARTVEKPIYLREDLHQMAKKKQFVTAAAAFAVAASAVAPAITADAASTTVRLSSDYVRGGDLDAALDKEYKGSEIYWYKSSIDMNKLGVFQTAKGFVKGKGIKVEKKLRVLNYAQEIKPESEFVFEQGVPVSGIRIQPVLFADGNEYAKPLSVAGFNTDKVGEFEGTLTYANKAYGSVTKTVKYKVVASKVEFSEVKHEVKDDMLSVSADVKNLKEGEKVELVIFPGKDESKALDPIAAEIKDGKVMVSAKDIPAGTHSFILRSGDVKTAAMEFKVEEQMTKVESLSASTLKTAKLSFNKAIDKDSLSASTVKVYLNGSTTSLSVDTNTADGVTAGQVAYVTSEDKKSVTLVFGTTLSQSDKLEVKVEKLKDEKAVEFSGVVNATVIDTALPEAVEAKALNAKTLQIKYSEAVQFPAVSKVFDEILIDGNKVAGTATLNAELNTVTLVLNTALASGTYNVTAKAVADYANFKTVDKSFTVTVGEDKVAPEVVAVNADQRDVVVVEFNEVINSNSGTIRVKGVDYALNGGRVTVDGKKATISLSTPLDAASAFISETLTYKGIKDVLGNEVDTKDGKTYSFLANNDSVKPTASLKVNEDNSVSVNFSEAVQGFTTANFELKNKDGNAVGVAQVNTVVAGKEYKIILSNPTVDAQNYTLKLKDVLDNSVRQNKIEETTSTLALNDRLAPSVSGSVTQLGSPANTIRIAFSEAMDKATLQDKSNYLIDLDGAGAGAETALGSISNSSISVSTDGKYVDITIPGLVAGTTSVKLLNVKDASGTRIIAGDFNTTKVVAATGTFLAGDVVAEATGRNTIVLTAQTTRVFGTTIDPNAIKIEDAAAPSASLYVTNAVRSEDGKKLTLTLNAPLTYDAKSGASAVKLYTVGSGVTDINGVALSITSGANAETVLDKIRPEIASVTSSTVGGDVDTFKITFTEAIGTGVTEADILGDLIVKDKDGKTFPIAAADITIATDKLSADVELTDGSPVFDEYAGTYSVQLLDRSIVDANGNVVIGKTITNVVVK